MREAIESDANGRALRRALKHGDLSRDDWSDVLERIGLRLADAPDRLGEEDALRFDSLDVIVRYLAQKRPDAGAKIACRAAERFAANGMSLIIPRAQLAVIAARGRQCNLDGVFERNRCNNGFACCKSGFTCPLPERHACSPEELKALVALEISRSPQNPWPGPFGGGFGYELLLAAARVQERSAPAQRFLERMKQAPECASR